MSHSLASGVEFITVIEPPIGRGETQQDALLDALRQAVARDTGSVVLRALTIGERLEVTLGDVTVTIDTLDGSVVYDEQPNGPDGLADRTLMPPIRVADSDTPWHGVIEVSYAPDRYLGVVETVQPYLFVRNIAATPWLDPVLHPTVNG